MLSLPIESIKEQFCHSIQKENLVVEAETGSGKSTQLPLWATSYGRVLVVEPRRIACTSLAEYIALHDGGRVGEKIGYSIKLDTCFSEASEVVFVTPGVALRWLSEDKLAGFDVVIVDEFHERRWDTDLLVALLKRLNKHRLVVTSATIEGEKLANYIGGKRLVANGRLFNVDVEYQAKSGHYLPDVRSIERKIADVVQAEYQSTLGDVLVFLPGRKEITQCAQALSKLEDVDVIKLHASVSDLERNRALTQQSKQRIVLATNVAETSLTIPNISLVIDSGLERRTMQRNGRTVLSLKSISLASAKQRLGRGGRVMDGRCIRLYGKFAALEAVTPPELLREELTEAMLASACCGYRLDELSFLDPLPAKSMQLASQFLSNMRAIDSKGKVTEHGRIIYPLPIDALYADLLTRMPNKGCQEAMVDLAAGLAVPANLYQLPKNQEKLEEVAQWETFNCDGETIIKLIRSDLNESLDLDREAIREAQLLANQMRCVLNLPQLEVSSRFDRKQWLSAIIQIHPELVFVRREKRREALGNGRIEMVPARNSRFGESDEAAIILDQHSLPGRGVKQTLNLATAMLPVPISMLIEMSLGDWIQGSTMVTEDAILTQLSLVYAGRTLARKQIEPEGELLLKPLIDAVINQNIFPDLAGKRSKEIDLWRLYVDLGLDENNASHNGLDFDQWFTKQLLDLGISDVEELLMFSEDDFPFEGIPYWQYDDFSKTYPFDLNLGDLQLRVDYLPYKKLIHIEYKSGLRKGDPKSWELPNWLGWRVHYKKASRVIVIR